MNNKKIVYLIIFALICLVAIGYAAIVSNISIVGTAKIKTNNFDVHFENVSVTSGSVEINTTNGDSAATIEPTNRTRVDYSVTLANPGDFYEFTVKVVNGGGMDAMINTVTSKMNNVVINNNLPNYLEYNVTYEDGIAIANNHMLNSGDVETYKVRVAYSTNINPGDLPTTASTMNFSFSVNYIQKDSNAITRPVGFVYTTSSTTQYIGQAFNTTSSPNPEIAMSTFGHNTFIRHKMNGNNIEKSYVGFKVGGTIYYLRGGAGDEGRNDSRPIYKDNKDELDKAFGSTNCIETNYTNYSYYRCSNDYVSSFVGSSGNVYATGANFECVVDVGGSSGCSEY
jgi:hypothetical protein